MKEARNVKKFILDDIGYKNDEYRDVSRCASCGKTTYISSGTGCCASCDGESL